MNHLKSQTACTDCKVRIELDMRGSSCGCTAKLIADILESIGSVRYGSVEVRIQDSKVVQIDTVAKRRIA